MLLEADQKCCRWLGVISRDTARSLEGARQVKLQISGWRHSVMQNWNWLPDGTAIVGCETDEGVYAVMDRDQPVIKTFASKTRCNG